MYDKVYAVFSTNLRRRNGLGVFAESPKIIEFKLNHKCCLKKMKHYPSGKNSIYTSKRHYTICDLINWSVFVRHTVNPFQSVSDNDDIYVSKLLKPGAFCTGCFSENLQIYKPGRIM